MFLDAGEGVGPVIGIRVHGKDAVRGPQRFFHQPEKFPVYRNFDGPKGRSCPNDRVKRFRVLLDEFSTVNDVDANARSENASWWIVESISSKTL